MSVTGKFSLARGTPHAHPAKLNQTRPRVSFPPQKCSRKNVFRWQIADSFFNGKYGHGSGGGLLGGHARARASGTRPGCVCKGDPPHFRSRPMFRNVQILFPVPKKTEALFMVHNMRARAPPELPQVRMAKSLQVLTARCQGSARFGWAGLG